eukprot:scaffold151590_cov14-Tisochrysis_lutea.AAC.1
MRCSPSASTFPGSRKLPNSSGMRGPVLLCGYILRLSFFPAPLEAMEVHQVAQGSTSGAGAGELMGDATPSECVPCPSHSPLNLDASDLGFYLLSPKLIRGLMVKSLKIVPATPIKMMIRAVLVL